MITVNSTDIHNISHTRQPLSVDAVVEEQDTCLLLGSEPVIYETRENYPRLVKEMEQQKPLQPGQVIVRETSPLHLVAINYDIEKSPVCQEAWLVNSLKNIFRECRKHRIRSIVMPLPGVKYGKLAAETSMNILKNTLLDEQTEYPGEIFIIYEQ